MRLQIFGLVQGDNPIRIDSRGKLVSAELDALVQSRGFNQKEIQASLFRCARVIEADVRDFDFRHVVRFLDELDTELLGGLAVRAPSRHGSRRRGAVDTDIPGAWKEPRILRLVLNVTPACDSALIGSALERWLERRGRVGARGSEVAVEYTVSPEHKLREWPWLSHWAHVLLEHMVAEGPSQEAVEMQEILGAVLRAFAEAY